MKFKITAGAVLLVLTVSAADVPSAEVQIAAAVLAAPPDLREGAAVLGYNPQGELVKLRDGKNELIRVANDPSKSSFSVACYHRDLEPYMVRGRELLAQKITGQKRNEIRWKEVEEGKLSMPREARTLYVLRQQLRQQQLESGGRLPTKASDNAPWLMFPGTAGAHIMINPQKK